MLNMYRAKEAMKPYERPGLHYQGPQNPTIKTSALREAIKQSATRKKKNARKGVLF